MVRLDNPYAPTAFPNEVAPIHGRQKVKGNWLWSATWFTAALFVGSIVSACIAYCDVESIVFSGPIMFVIAIVQTWLSLRSARTLAFMGVLVMVFTIGCFFTILLNHWSPGDAQRPVSIAISVFALLLNSQWVTLWYYLKRNVSLIAATSPALRATDS